MAALVSGAVTMRELRSLVMGLPREAATVRAILGTDSEWSLSAHLLAALVDATNAGNWQRGGGKGGRPKRVPRPGSAPAGTHLGHTDRDPAEVKAYLDRFKPMSN